MASVLIYGVLPPPYGGVSIYNKRLICYLEKHGVDYVFFSSNKTATQKNKTKPFWHIVYKNLNFSKRVIHISGFGSYKSHIVFICLKTIFKKRIVVTIHNDRFSEDYAALSFPKNVLAFLFYKNISRLIAVNEKTNFLFVNHRKVVHIPAFMPPASKELDCNNLPQFFHDTRKKHNYLITASASIISFYKNEDLYGIDLSIDLLKKLIEKGYDDVGLIFVIPEIGDFVYYQEMQQLLKTYNLTDHFHFYTQPVMYPAVICLSDIFLRPTNTDGDAISLREALFLKKPSIASDAVIRPEGSLVFKSRDIDDLVKKTEHVLQKYKENKHRLSHIAFEDNANKIIDVYAKVLRK